MAVQFIQHLRPDGRKTYTEIELPPEVEKMANDLMLGGFWFESEVLTTGEAHFTVTDSEDDYVHEICENGPEVPHVVSRMIRVAHEMLSNGTLKRRT